MNFTIGLISQELSCELFIVLYLLVKYPVAHFLYSRISQWKVPVPAPLRNALIYFFQVFPIHQEYLKTPKQNRDTGLWYYCNSKISLVHNQKDGNWILHFHSTRLRFHFPGLLETDNTEIGYQLIMTYWRHGIELYVLMPIGCHCYLSVLPVNISTPLIQRAQPSVDTLLNDVREMGFSKYTKTSSESR